MRTITQYSQHVYTTKASAKRAALNAVCSTYLVDDPELRNRFDGEITIDSDMIDVVAVGNGWQWSYTFDLYDVVVKVRHADGTIEHTRYANVAHWQDATTPPVEPEENPVHAVAKQVNDYVKAWSAAESDEERFALHDPTVPRLIAACHSLGIDYTDVYSACRAVQDVIMSSSPSYIAEIIVRAESYGLASDVLHAHLRVWAVRRGVKPAVYLDHARATLASNAA